MKKMSFAFPDKKKDSQVGLCMLIISALRRQRQEECHELEASKPGLHRETLSPASEKERRCLELFTSPILVIKFSHIKSSSFSFKSPLRTDFVAHQEWWSVSVFPDAQFKARPRSQSKTLFRERETERLRQERQAGREGEKEGLHLIITSSPTWLCHTHGLQSDCQPERFQVSGLNTQRRFNREHSFFKPKSQLTFQNDKYFVIPFSIFPQRLSLQILDIDKIL